VIDAVLGLSANGQLSTISPCVRPPNGYKSAAGDHAHAHTTLPSTALHRSATPSSGLRRPACRLHARVRRLPAMIYALPLARLAP
jgi:hypothetical protein